MPDTSVNLTANIEQKLAQKVLLLFNLPWTFLASMQLSRTVGYGHPAAKKSGRVRFQLRGNGRRESELSVGLEHPVSNLRQLCRPHLESCLKGQGEETHGDQLDEETGDRGCLHHHSASPSSHTHPDLHIDMWGTTVPWR